jgi:hypothetical protein
VRGAGGAVLAGREREVVRRIFREAVSRFPPGGVLSDVHPRKLAMRSEELKKAAWAKELELAKLATKEKKHFKSAIWLHRAQAATALAGTAWR